LWDSTPRGSREAFTPIRVVLDFHQDVFSRRNCGDGFPDWALADPEVERPADCSVGLVQRPDAYEPDGVAGAGVVAP
jgi:hypothetical protein